MLYLWPIPTHTRFIRICFRSTSQTTWKVLSMTLQTFQLARLLCCGRLSSFFLLFSLLLFFIVSVLGHDYSVPQFCLPKRMHLPIYIYNVKYLPFKFDSAVSYFACLHIILMTTFTTPTYNNNNNPYSQLYCERSKIASRHANQIIKWNWIYSECLHTSTLSAFIY